MVGVRVSEVNLLKRMISDGLVDKEQAQELLVDVVYRRKKGESASLPQALLNAGVATVEQLVDYGAAQPGTVREPVAVPAQTPADPLRSDGPRSGPESTPNRMHSSVEASPASSAVVTPVADSSKTTPVETERKEDPPSAPTDTVDASELADTNRPDDAINPDATGDGPTPSTDSGAETKKAKPVRPPQPRIVDDSIDDNSPIDASPLSSEPPSKGYADPIVDPEPDAPDEARRRTRESASESTWNRQENEPRTEKRYPPVRTDDGFPAREFLVYYQQAQPARFKTDRRRPVLWILLFLVVGGGAGGGVWWYLQKPTVTYSDDQPIIECFESFTSALADRNGTEAALWLGRNSTRYFHDMRYEALMRTREQLVSQPRANLLNILSIRQAFPERAQLEGYTGRQLFAEFVDRGWVQLPTLAPVEVTEVAIDGRSATAVFIADGEELSLGWRFEREREGWRVQMVPTDEARVAFDEADLLRELTERTGIPATDDIWTPLVY